MNSVKCSCGAWTWNEDGICDACLEVGEEFMEDDNEC